MKACQGIYEAWHETSSLIIAYKLHDKNISMHHPFLSNPHMRKKGEGMRKFWQTSLLSKPCIVGFCCPWFELAATPLHGFHQFDGILCKSNPREAFFALLVLDAKFDIFNVSDVLNQIKHWPFPWNLFIIYRDRILNMQLFNEQFLRPVIV